MKRELAKLIAAQVCLHASMAGTRMAAPLMALRTGQTEAAVGLLLAMFALMQVFLALPAGRYVDAHGLKRSFAWSVIMGSLGAGVAVLWPIFPVLCLSGLMTGGASGIAIIALQRHVGRVAKDVTQMKQAFSWLSIAPAFSNFVGPFIAGLLIDHAGFHWAFAAMAVLPWLAGVWIRMVRDLPPWVGAQDGAKNRAWDLLNNPMFRRLLLVNWFLSACWDIHTFVVPILGHERGISASAIGSILGAFAMAAAFIRMMMPFLAARLHEWQVITGAMVVTSGVLAIYPCTSSAMGMGICSVMLGLSLGGVQPMVMSTLHQITPAHRQGEALGLRLMGINASSVLMPMVFGAAGTVIGISGVFWAVSMVVGCGSHSAYHLRVHKTHE